ncbi:hypothetical protein [Streptomyces sp. CMB-StM0423]|uniref:hypothetical protein n=1 Tax=Streptomyces sp. CMB-StM0423 TaxID=2059884 RepID=UPI000C6FD506|nr:hypothetical protein [Streptomyces sp. CMB-StM0423]AUH40929.1 hypothetical protein CXR04_12290 [Streptomyces sp. CMB-StM0423]
MLPAPGRHGPLGRQGPPGLPGPTVMALRHPREQPLEEALAEVSAVLEQHGFLVVLHPAAGPAEVVRRLHTVRSVLESDRMALIALPLPPLAVAVIARQLLQLSTADLGAGVLATAARLLTHYIHAGAVLGSVAKLDRVPVTLGAHARSWVPGAQFAVLAAPRPQLVRIGRDPVPPGPDFATGLVHASGRADAAWVTGELAAGWRVQAMEMAPLPAASAPWWATDKVCEFAAGITDPLVLSRLVASVQRARCSWCGLEIIGDRCLLCATPVPPGPAAPSPPLPQAVPQSMPQPVPHQGAPPPLAQPPPRSVPQPHHQPAVGAAPPSPPEINR